VAEIDHKECFSEIIYESISVGDEFVALICSLIGAVIYFISSYFLITGIKSVSWCFSLSTFSSHVMSLWKFQRSHIFVQPFRLLCFVAFAAIIVLIIVSIYLSIIKFKDSENRTVKFYHVLMEIAALAFETYILICISSLHKRFKSEMFGGRNFIVSY
jgi:hypothetical protein